MNLDFEGDAVGTLDDLICARIVGKYGMESFEISTCTLTYACDEAGEDEDGTKWEFSCDDGASKLVAAGTALLMLAYAM